jgi:hypothetical protein
VKPVIIRILQQLIVTKTYFGNGTKADEPGRKIAGAAEELEITYDLFFEQCWKMPVKGSSSYCAKSLTSLIILAKYCQIVKSRNEDAIPFDASEPKSHEVNLCTCLKLMRKNVNHAVNAWMSAPRMYWKPRMIKQMLRTRTSVSVVNLAFRFAPKRQLPFRKSESVGL